MRSRPTIWIVLSLLLLAVAWLFWPHARRVVLEKFTPPVAGALHPASTAPVIFTPKTASANSSKNGTATAAKTNQFPYRLSNTAKSIGELVGDRRAILLENALIDTRAKLDFSIPKNLQAQGDPGAYIVQSRGPIDAAFRAVLAASGAQVVSYIPNNAYLVRIPAGGANALAANPPVQSVIPYEPYYKVQPPLLAFDQKPLPAGAVLNLGLFADNAAATIQQVEKLGGIVLSQDSSPFGPIVRVRPPADWTALAQLPGVQIVEPGHARKLANDLSRVTTGVATNTINGTNYLGLTGLNVTVEVNDSGIDATHPDFATGRVIGDAPGSLVDTDGHGTFVAGEIAGNGAESMTVTNAQGSINPGTNGQYRGSAPLATLYSVGGIDGADTNAISDRYFQEAPALTNALISNNSWGYGGDTFYDLAAASYDWAVRDALSGSNGAQPVLFVFAAGNDGHIGKNGGNGDDAGGGGTPDSISSPGTAKDVITVGALEQLRNITNLVTALDGTSNAVWQPETDSSTEVADYSSRGNVGIGMEGTFGRFKPDVVAPGTFVVSTRSQQWDEQAYYNPTDVYVNDADDQLVDAGGLNYYNFPGVVPNNAVSVSIQILPDALSPNPFPTDMPVYVSLDNYPAPPDTTTYDFETMKDGVAIPPDSGGNINSIQDIINNLGGFNFAVGDSTNIPVNYDLRASMSTTNDMGNYFTVLSNLNNSLGGDPDSTIPPHYYRYESGTSMAAADVSGILALMQDFFINTLHLTPSPALLKAMLINGARPTGFYNFQVDNAINFEGWGLVNLPNSIPSSLTNTVASTNMSLFFVDQSPANALATGDSRTYQISLSPAAELLPLRLTLAWTDPPGNPAAAIKLVNNLDLIVTNMDTTNVYYGNDIGANQVFNSQENPTNPSPNLDAVNNVENVFLPAGSGTNFTVVVRGAGVNVNAVTAQTNNAAGNFAPDIVQDYALVISSGNGSNTNGFSVTTGPAVSNPTGGQRITMVTSTNTPLLNQIVGANSPLLGTNTVGFAAGTNKLVTVGQTNQWHFYVVHNTGATVNFTNAAFVTFLSQTLSIPRGGAFASSATNATRIEADIDIYVSTDPGLLNLDPTVISKCVNGTQFGASAGGVFNGASLGRGGSELVVDTHSTPGQVYYVGVKSEDQMAAEYDFLSEFSEQPFSQTDENGNLYVTFNPVSIPDGDATHPGFVDSVGVAFSLAPIEIQRVIMTNILSQQDAGDLVVSLDGDGGDGGNDSVVLLNHDSPNYPGVFTYVYDDSGEGDITLSQPSDGPGSLQSFTGQQSLFFIWVLHTSDNAPAFIGSIRGSMKIEPHQPLGIGVTNTIAPDSWFYDYIDVPNGYTNLTVYATNLPPTSVPPLQLYLNVGAEPTLTDFLLEADLTNCPPGLGVYPTGTDPGNSISYGPPLQPARYWVGVYNPSSSSQKVYVLAKLNGGEVAPQQTDVDTNGPALIDDAVTTNEIFISETNQIVSVNVGLVVNHPRISDLAFTLVSPTGQRVLLMENRGGLAATNIGDVFFTTNNFAPVTANGGPAPETNSFNVGETYGSFTISYDMFSIPDEMAVYYSTNIIPANLIYDTGLVSGSNTVTVTFGPGTSTYVTIIMNPNGNTNGITQWIYTAGSLQQNYNYLTFTEDTNLTTIPIKFAVPPYDLSDFGTNFALTDFESEMSSNYFAPLTNVFTNVSSPFGGWNMFTNPITTNLFGATNILWSNEVSVVTDPATAQAGSNYLALADGSISRTIPLTIGKKYSFTYQYRGPGISAWWRGEGNATDSSDPETNGNNGSLVGRFNYPAGEVGQAFQFEDAGADFEFAGTNTYVQIRQSPSLNAGTNGFTVEGWINPTNVSHQEPLVEWLSQMPTNGSDTNLVIKAGPFLDRATSHYYYLLAATNWTTSETWATQLGGHLATVDTANEENWIYDTFASYAGTNRGALWIGLNDASGTFMYSSGLANITYTNWATGQPDNSCNGNTEHYTAIVTATNALSGLWVLATDNGLSCTTPATNIAYGVVEVNNLQTNGVRFWISVTNTPGTTNSLLSSNGCLYANIVDVSNVTHEIYSAPGLIQSNIYQHVALTYSTNTGIANLYYDGTNVASSNLTVFVPKTGGDVLLGKDMSLDTNNFYSGKMDEMSIYSRPLSDAEIRTIYEISNLTTNRNVGKFDPAVTPAEGLAEADVSFNGMTNVIFGANNSWAQGSFPLFTAVTNALTWQITGVEPGMLLDSFEVAEPPVGNLYYLPEQSLAELAGTPANGTGIPGQTNAWTLEIWDSRTGAVATDAQLVDWQLQFVLQTNVFAAPLSLNPQDPTSITVPPGQTVYLYVAVPSWANFATNILDSASGPVDVLFNPSAPPSGGANDTPLMTGITAPPTNAFATLSVASVPPLPASPTNFYYLGVRNTGTHAVTAVVEVDFDITVLSNNVPVSDVLNTANPVRYFAFDVSSNAFEATFQLLQLSGNADLVVRKGAPLPTLYSSDYGSFNATNADENIYVLTNSLPVPLSAGRWYLGVFNRDSGVVNYTVLAKELDATNGGYAIIDLTNGVPFNFTAGPGAALTNFFRFTVTNTLTSTLTNYVGAIRFELYNLSGNGDLTVQGNAPPFAPPFFQSSRNPGRTDELIDIRTNSALTNLAAAWYLGVPNNESNLITYTILAEIETNGVFAAFPGAEGAGAGALGGRGGDVYHVLNLNDDGLGSLRYGITSFIGTGAANTPGTGTTNLADGSITNFSGARTIVFDVSGTIQLLSPLVISNSYLTIAGQTSPNGITVAGEMTTVQSAHDVVIRYVRFRPSYLIPSGPATNAVTVWSNGFEGGTVNYTVYSGQNLAGWNVDFGSVDWLTNGLGPAYEGNYYIDLDGVSAGGISTNIPTVSGVTYTLNVAYTKNPNASVSQASVLINGSSVGTLTANVANAIGNLQWQTASFVFTANSSPATLAFHSLDPSGDLSGVLMDLVSITTNVVYNFNPSDSLQLTNVSDVVVDHISASWSTNEIVSVLNSTNVSVQWSVLSDSLNNTNNPHGYGSNLRYGHGALSFHHNLYADNYNASPRLGDNLKLDFVNNVIYDWGTNAGFSTNDISDNLLGFTNELNYAGNYLIAGSDSKMTNIAFYGGTTNTWIFQTNNFMDGNKNGVLDGADTGWNMFTNLYTQTNRPFDLPAMGIDESFIAYERVQDFAGVSMGQRDLFDTNIVGNVRSQTGKIISTAPLSGLVAWWQAEGNALDSVGTNNGTLSGGVGYTSGMVGQAFSFDGSDSVIVPDSPSLDPTNAITIEYWIYAFARPPFAWTQDVLGKDNYCIGQRQYKLEIGDSPSNPGTGDFRAHIGVPSGFQILDGATVVQTNTWYHVAETYDGTTLKLYVNGNLDGQMAVTGPIVPTTEPVRLGGDTPGCGSQYFFDGLLDEPSIYNRALSSNEIQIIYNAGVGGKLFLSSTPPPLDTDRDGIPDYWETTLGENPTNFTATADRDTNGYTDLEEYMNWLAAPHALTATNAPVGVDLYALCGKTGNLSFSLTNAVNGSVYLTNVLGSVTNTGTFSNSIAVFTPMSNGFASFGFFVTNNATIAYFGPVAVSVMNSAVPVTYGTVIALTNSVKTGNTITNPPLTNAVVIPAGGIVYYSIFAPANADYATNILTFASGPLNMWFNQNLLPSGSNPGDFELLTNSTVGSSVLGTVPPPTPVFEAGQYYYLALQNTNSVAVTNYAIEVDFHFLTVFHFGGIGKVSVTSSGVQLQWDASGGAQIQVQWTTNLVSPIIWNTITNPATTTINGVSTFTDDGSQTAPLGRTRFYRLVQPLP